MNLPLLMFNQLKRVRIFCAEVYRLQLISFVGLLESTFATVPLPSCTTDLYAVRVPLSEIQSFRKMSSTIGMHYSIYVRMRFLCRVGTPNIIVVLQGGIALPPYYFHAGGVREFLSCVEDYATLIK
jgi:hypothetical protein